MLKLTEDGRYVIQDEGSPVTLYVENYGFASELEFDDPFERIRYTAILSQEERLQLVSVLLADMGVDQVILGRFPFVTVGGVTA